MSDRIDWIIPSGFDNPGWIIPTAAWSTWAAFQFGSAIREWWTKREVRQRRSRWEMSEWSKVRQGEVKRGYRLWLEPRCCPYSRVKCHKYVATLLPNNDNVRSEREEEDMASAFKVIQHRMPNTASQYSRVLRRYSIFTPNVYTDIAQVIFQFRPMESGWEPMLDTQLDEGTVAMVYKRRTLARVRAILIDVEEKSSRLLEITPPPGIRMILFMCRDDKRKNRLRIVYDMQEANSQEVITVDYEISRSDRYPSRLYACEVASQSIKIPGRRKCGPSSIPGSFHLDSIHPNGRSFVLKFDHRGNYQIDSYDVWWEKFEVSILGQQLIKAGGDFKCLLPEIPSGNLNGYLFRGKHLQVVFKDVQSPKPAWPIVQRQLQVPSLKSLAAEAICRANPTADLSVIKAETGVDIFDGICENREKPMPTIRMIPDGEDDD